METVIVAFEQEIQAKKMKDLLESSCDVNCCVCQSGAQVRRALQTKQAYLVVSGCHLSDGHAEWLYDDLPPACSLLLVGQRHQLDLCRGRDIIKMATPISKGDLVTTVNLLLQFGRRLERVLRSRRPAPQQQEIDRAKKLLMQMKAVSEEEAHRLIQKQSMDSGTPMAQTAKQILAQYG